MKPRSSVTKDGPIEQLALEWVPSIVTLDIGDDFAKAAGADVAPGVHGARSCGRQYRKAGWMKLPVVVGTLGG